jgi:hypothetical protein
MKFLRNIFKPFDVKEKWNTATPLVKVMLCGRVGLALLCAVYKESGQLEELYHQAKGTLQDMFEKRLNTDNVKYIVAKCFEEGWLEPSKREYLNDALMKKHVEDWNKMVQLNGLPDFWKMNIQAPIVNNFAEAMAKSSEKDKSISEDMETIKDILKKYTK